MNALQGPPCLKSETTAVTVSTALRRDEESSEFLKVQECYVMFINHHSACYGAVRHH